MPEPTLSFPDRIKARFGERVSVAVRAHGEHGAIVAGGRSRHEAVQVTNEARDRRLRLQVRGSGEAREQTRISVLLVQVIPRLDDAIGHREQQLPRLYRAARRAAILGLEEYEEAEAARLLPDASPWTLEDVLREVWYPGSRLS